MFGNDGGCVPVPVTCDGPEDCPSGQVCCGTLDLAVGGYTDVSCQSSCGTAEAGAFDGAVMGTMLMLQLCHADSVCPMGTTCGTSMFLPPFLYRCNTPSTPPPSTAVGDPGVNCGTATCGTGQECCVLGQTGAAAQTYCAPKGTACSCTPPADAGSTADASGDAGDATVAEAASDAAVPEAASDTAVPEAASDAPTEASSEAGSDAAGDVTASDGHE
jgi:hypothetical protein